MLEIAKHLEPSLDYLLLDDLTNGFSDSDSDKILIEFKNIINQFDDKSFIKEYIIYCKGIANSMNEIKKGI